MPYEKNKTSYQDEQWFEREQRNVLDVHNWNRDLMGQTFYQICQDNKNKYRTIQFKWNPFVESLRPMISDPIDGAPPEGMKPVPAGALQRAASEISTEQSEELVNTQNRESYFSFGVESTHRYGCSFFMPSFKEREEKRNPHILKKVSLHAAPEKERYT